MNNDHTIYKNVSKLPRTLSEANKDADYATPIWRCETDLEKGIKFFVEMLVGMLVVALPLTLIYSLMVWLDMPK